MSESTTSGVVSFVSPPSPHNTHTRAHMRLLQLVSKQEALHVGQVERSGNFLRLGSILVSAKSTARVATKPVGLTRSFFGQFWSFRPPFGLCKVLAALFGLFPTRCRICILCRFGSFDHTGAAFGVVYSTSTDLQATSAVCQHTVYIDTGIF